MRTLERIVETVLIIGFVAVVGGALWVMVYACSPFQLDDTNPNSPKICV